MIYIFDTSVFIAMFNWYYESRFPTLWNKFYEMISLNEIISVKEVYQEIMINPKLPKPNAERLTKWVKENKIIFEEIGEDESNYLKEIFENEHFQQLIGEKQRQIGSPVADPFLIAKARYCNGCVVTDEAYKANSSKVPNVCESFNIEYASLEMFMTKENWIF